MSEPNYSLSTPENPPSIEDTTNTIRLKTEEIIQCCMAGAETNFYRAEQSLRSQVYQLACLFLELYLLCYHERFDYAGWLTTRLPKRCGRGANQGEGIDAKTPRVMSRKPNPVSLTSRSPVCAWIAGLQHSPRLRRADTMKPLSCTVHRPA